MRRLSLWIVGAAAFALAAAASVPVQAETPKDTLVIAKQIDDIITLDPAEVFEFTGGEVIANVYDRIFTFEAEDTATLLGEAPPTVLSACHGCENLSNSTSAVPAHATLVRSLDVEPRQYERSGRPPVRPKWAGVQCSDTQDMPAGEMWA